MAGAVLMQEATLIFNATVIDVDAGVARGGMNILVRDGRIESVSTTPVTCRAYRIDAAGAWVCPGLIDGHVHLFLDAGCAPRTAFLNSTDDEKFETAARNAAVAISAGITTVRDCGGPAALVFRFQQAVERGDLPGPRILAAGSPLTRPRGHCHFFGVEIATPAEVRRAVDGQVRQGAAFVKLIASGGGLTPGTHPSEADLPLEIMREAVTAARANGIHVAAHCHAVESIARALDAGVDTIEHASFVRKQGAPEIDPELAARIRDAGVVVSPTAISGIRIAQGIRESGTQNGHDRAAVERLESRRRHTARFCEAGVRILAGTDCGVANTPFDSLLDELLEYVNVGMSTAAALRSATSDSARFLNQPLLGRLEAGSSADLLLLSGNPLESLDHLRNPMLVMKEGDIVCDFRPAPISAS
jgi:imidazolonepropionase-like amidohydrolase